MNPYHPNALADELIPYAVTQTTVMSICSICAPKHLGKDTVAAFAAEKVPTPFGSWRSINKRQLGPEHGAETPSPCNIYSDRMHWFLVADAIK